MGAALILLAAAASASAQPEIEIRINCGADPAGADYVDDLGRAWTPDREYTQSPEPRYGFVGGQVEHCTIPFVGGHYGSPILYLVSRIGFEEYRFDVPDGTYVVHLRFADTCHHGILQRVFDVSLEGDPVLAGLDIIAEVGKDHAIDFAFAVPVSDGTLNLAVTPLLGEPLLSGVSVTSLAPDADGPGAPQLVQAVGGYGRNIVSWLPNHEPDLAGYVVYRSLDPAGPFTLITPAPAMPCRFYDDDATVGADLFYRVHGVDVWGNEGPPGEMVSAAAVHKSASPLPVYEIGVTPENLATLNADPFSDDYVPAIFAHAGEYFPDARIRYRGSVSRQHPKKNWKIRFTDDHLFFDRAKVNLQAGYEDWSLMRETLSYGLFGLVGIPAATIQHVHLQVNGEFAGLYLDIEQIDERFLSLRHLEDDGSIYKANYLASLHTLTYPDFVQVLYEKENNKSDGYEDLVHFMDAINNATDEEFPCLAHQLLDVTEYLDYYAMIILTANPDFTAHNYYLYHDIERGKWMVFPWDLTWGPPNSPIDLGVEGSPDTTGLANRLISRLMQVDAFRDYHAARLEEWITSFFNPDVMNTFIDGTHNAIAFDARRDVCKQGWERNELFDHGPVVLKEFVMARGPFLLGEITTFAPLAGPYLHINEIMPDNRTTVADESGEYDAWFELYNAAPTPVDLAGMSLTDDQADPEKFVIPPGVTIAGGGHLVFWTDGSTAQGGTHVSFTLDPAGGDLALFDASAILVDACAYGSATPDDSQGRQPDGADNVAMLDAPSPGDWNHRPGIGPTITDVQHTPAYPAASDDVLITCRVVDDKAVADVSVVLGIGFGLASVTMFDDGAHGDGAAGDGLYGATIPALPLGTQITYYIMAQDDQGFRRFDPAKAPILKHTFSVGQAPLPLFINEFMADNDNVLPDEHGDFDDWIELYNAGPDPVDLGGMYLTDNLANPTKWQFPPGVTIAAGGWLIVWADNQPEQGATHATFALSAGGEQIGLVHTDGLTFIDQHTFGPQATDVSEGRLPDGADNWVTFTAASPGASNGSGNAPPTIIETAHSPAQPTDADIVTVTCRVDDDSAVAAVVITVDIGTGPFSDNLYDDGAHGDGDAGDGIYGGLLPPLPNGTQLRYYITATDDDGLSAIDPPGAPANTYLYIVGQTPLPLFINEFMADNDNVIPDEHGDFDDWIELYNAGPDPIDLGGMSLTDNLANPTKWQFPPGVTIAAGGWLIVWADNEPEQGATHATFALSAGGEQIGLFDTDARGNVPVDTLSFGAQQTDVSYGRCPDGSAHLRLFVPGTPGTENQPCDVYIPGDFNNDGDVDRFDQATFESCASGPGVPLVGDCGDADFDLDNDVDHADFSVFQRCYRGENIPADPNCAE